MRVHDARVEQPQPLPVESLPVHLHVVVDVHEHVRLVHDLVPDNHLYNVLQGDDAAHGVVGILVVVVHHVPHSRNVPPSLLKIAEDVTQRIVRPHPVQAPAENLHEMPHRHVIPRIDKNEILHQQQPNHVVLARLVHGYPAETAPKYLPHGDEIQHIDAGQHKHVLQRRHGVPHRHVVILQRPAHGGPRLSVHASLLHVYLHETAELRLAVGHGEFAPQHPVEDESEGTGEGIHEAHDDADQGSGSGPKVEGVAGARGLGDYLAEYDNDDGGDYDSNY
mmetsp:Transcript_19867/g.30570  ORF Transcript_19867/g.30570 Transcript_19867/m.30570 type:complete len:278 (-) Transcript_19867:480-1313(-)